MGTQLSSINRKISEQHVHDVLPANQDERQKILKTFDVEEIKFLL